jgi:hypothetical protein
MESSKKSFTDLKGTPTGERHKPMLAVDPIPAQILMLKFDQAQKNQEIQANGKNWKDLTLTMLKIFSESEVHNSHDWNSLGFDEKIAQLQDLVDRFYDLSFGFGLLTNLLKDIDAPKEKYLRDKEKEIRNKIFREVNEMVEE